MDFDDGIDFDDPNMIGLGPRARDRLRGILHPAGLGGMELKLKFVPMSLAAMGVPVEPKAVRQLFVAELETDIEKKRCLPPSDEDFALITDQARLEALCVDFYARYGSGAEFEEPATEEEARRQMRSYAADFVDVPPADEIEPRPAMRFN